jgi:hypothetical protein
MTQITNEHVEWAVVDRLRQMLDEPPHQTFNVTQAYALFTTILCWVMQRIRRDDEIARGVLKKLKEAPIEGDPWGVRLTARLQPVRVPAPRGFEGRKAERFLINLRNATAHGDASKVVPFNEQIRGERLLVGFTFKCDEPGGNRPKTWEGEITLLESDLRRIGRALAKLYCDALRGSEAHRRDSQFGSDAERSVREVAA